jgi:hypothetical protein
MLAHLGDSSCFAPQVIHASILFRAAKVKALAHSKLAMPV